MKALNLETLGTGIDGIVKSFGDFMTDCAGYSFMEHNHLSGVKITVKTDDAEETFQVNWNVQMTADLQKSAKDPERTTEFGAMGIAILLTLALTQYDSFEVSRKGTGVDFWLFKTSTDELDFGKAEPRLEISGIKKASRQNNLKRRVEVKKQQSKKSASSGTSAYIAVAEFSKPESAFVTA